MLFFVLVVGLAAGAFPTPGESIVTARGAKLRIMKFLDSGSSSKIYSAIRVGTEDNRLPREVVVKYLCPKEDSYLHHMDQEMIALAKLGEAGIQGVVRGYFASGLQSGNCRYIILSRTGRDFDRFVWSSDDFNSVKLEGHVQSITGRLSVEAFAASVGLILINTFRRVHNAGVAHQDVFPYNVALSYPLGDSPVLIDFGGAMFRDSVTERQFEGFVRSDETQLRKMISWIIHQRIAHEFGKPRRDELKVQSKLFRLIEASNTSDELEITLIQYLREEQGVEWSMIPDKIMYHAE